MPNSVSDLNQTPIFEWYVVKIGSKNGYQNEACFRETRWHVENMITSLGSIVNRIGEGGGGRDVYDHLMSRRIFTLTMSTIFIRAPKVTRKVTTASIWILLTILC